MTYVTPDALYGLLPAIYRIRDAEQGGPLRALVEVLGQQGRLLERDIERLYDNAFIETCDEWVVPYIGDLLGVRALHGLDDVTGVSQRARVANTIAYRRRKGTATMLEQLTRDTTGWPARAVEFFELVATTQHTNHPRLHNARTPDLRRMDALERIDSAFDEVAHTADVRHISSGRGRHNLPNVGLFVWRLQAYAVERTEARAVAGAPAGRYHLHPYGLDVPLFNRPQTETEISHLAEETNVPGPLRRRPLFDELVARRAAFEAGQAPEPVYFGDQPPVEVYLDGAAEPLAPEQILVCRLDGEAPNGWDDPAWAPSASTVRTAPGGDTWVTRVAVDPRLGRLAVLPGAPVPTRVEARFAYGLPGDVGGGPYDRRESLDQALTRTPTWTATVGQGGDFAVIGAALTGPSGWNAHVSATAADPEGPVGVIVLTDDATYTGGLTGARRIRIPEAGLLVIVAATVGGDGLPAPLDRRAHLLGDVDVEGTAPTGSSTPGALVLDGLLIEGRARVLGAHAGHNLGGLRLAHCTLGLHQDAPLGVRVGTASGANPELLVDLDHTLSGPVSAPASIRGVRLLDSVILTEAGAAGTDGASVALSGESGRPGPPAHIERCTLLGSVRVRELTFGSESLFLRGVVAERLQTGCVRFSYLAPDSRTPRRYRCQPDLALASRAEALGRTLAPGERDAIVRRMRPSFTAARYGQPALVQLAATTAPEILAGAENGSEMGVWSHLKQPQRLANLEAGLDEYLRFGLEAGVLFAT